MNKNNFMKAMGMIDEDLIKDADTSYTGEETFANAEELYSESKPEIVVSGVDVYHGTVWKKILAVAATFVIVTGVVGGGAYYFSQMKNSDNNIEDNNEDNIEYASIYDKLKANREKYMMNTVLCVFDGAGGGYSHLESEEQNEFFEYMDQFDLITETENISKTARHLKFNFGTDENIYYIFDLYENGDYSWTDTSTEKTTYHSFIKGKESFDDFMKMYKLDAISSDLFNWNDVYEEEIKGFIDESYSSSFDPTSSLLNTAIKHEGSKTEMYEYKDIDQINNIILSCDWVRAGDFDFSEYYSINGISLSEDGYMAGYKNGYFVVYKLKDIVYLDKLRLIWDDCMIPMENAFIDIDSNDINKELQQIKNVTTVQWLKGPTGCPQGRFMYDTVARYYTLNDAENFINEIKSFEWGICGSSELEEKCYYKNNGYVYASKGSYEIETSVSISIFPSGYMKIDDICYKLKNESDTGLFGKLFDKYLIMDESSKLAEKICNGITNYDNLKTHFRYEKIYSDDAKESIDGYMSVDVKNEKLYMKGDGKLCNEDSDHTIELVMNGHDNSAFRAVNKRTGETDPLRIGLYAYSNGYANSPPDNYIYICKSIEKYLTPRMSSQYTGFYLEESKTDRNTNITVHCKDPDGGYYDFSYNIILNENGQLISYEMTSGTYSEKFEIDDYVFDSPDFTMEDVGTIYDSIKAESDENIKNTGQ